MPKLSEFPDVFQDYFFDLDQRTKINQDTLERLQADDRLKDGPERNVTWIMQHSHLPWMPLSLAFPHQEMLKEAENVLDRFQYHRTDGEPGTYAGNKGWKAVCLHGIEWDKTHTPSVYGFSEKTAPYKWTEIADLCPVTTQYFKNVYPCQEYYRVRYIMLEPGGYIYPHTDGNHGLLWYVNFALNNPKDFHFKMKGQGYLPFQPGKAMMLDTFNEHALVNLSSEPRIHMIVHGMPLKEVGFHKIVEQSYTDLCQNPDLFWRG